MDDRVKPGDECAVVIAEKEPSTDRDPGFALSARHPSRLLPTWITYEPNSGKPEFGDDALSARQFSTRFSLGLSSENVGTSISNRSPVSLTI